MNVFLGYTSACLVNCRYELGFRFVFEHCHFFFECWLQSFDGAEVGRGSSPSSHRYCCFFKNAATTFALLHFLSVYFFSISLMNPSSPVFSLSLLPRSTSPYSPSTAEKYGEVEVIVGHNSSTPTNNRSVTNTNS